MSRLARSVVPGLPLTQRGNRREPIFFEDGDQEVYRDLLAEQAIRRRVEVWAYCLMPNHVHLILTPSDEAGLGLAVGEAHRRYANFINTRGRWTGHLFQGRYASVAPVLSRVERCAALLSTSPDEPGFKALRGSEGSGRPLGNHEFISGLERLLGRPIARRAPGRKPKEPTSSQLDLLM